MMKKLSRRSFLQASGVLAATAALTACDWADIEDEARAAGVTAFCEKPLDVPHLLRVLADALKK